MNHISNYHTMLIWNREHCGNIVMGNGPIMDFSVPPDPQGHTGVLTPKDTFVAAINTCRILQSYKKSC